MIIINVDIVEYNTEAQILNEFLEYEYKPKVEIGNMVVSQVVEKHIHDSKASDDNIYDPCTAKLMRNTNIPMIYNSEKMKREYDNVCTIK
jgi:hypothetical protein